MYNIIEHNALYFFYYHYIQCPALALYRGCVPPLLLPRLLGDELAEAGPELRLVHEHLYHGADIHGVVLLFLVHVVHDTVALSQVLVRI